MLSNKWIKNILLSTAVQTAQPQRKEVPGMKQIAQLTPHRKKKFLMEFRRYLKNYLDHPAIRNRYQQTGKTN